MSIPRPDAIEFAGLNAGEKPCLKLVYNLPGPQQIVVTGAPFASESPATRQKQIEDMLARLAEQDGDIK